jgi:hypothetical protein
VACFSAAETEYWIKWGILRIERFQDIKFTFLSVSGNTQFVVAHYINIPVFIVGEH